MKRLSNRFSLAVAAAIMTCAMASSSALATSDHAIGEVHGITSDLVFAPAFATINEGQLDAIFSQPSFGSTPIDIVLQPLVQLEAPELLNIDSVTTQNQVLGGSDVVPYPGLNLFFVDSISYCGGPGSGIVGCAGIGGNSLVVASSTAASVFGSELIAHEIGHTLGLGHFDSAPNLMTAFLNNNTNLTTGQVASVLNSGLLQQDTGGDYFLEITPIQVLDGPGPGPIDAVVAVDFQVAGAGAGTQFGFVPVEVAESSGTSNVSAQDLNSTGIDLSLVATGGGIFQGRGAGNDRTPLPGDPLDALLQDTIAARNGDGGVELTLGGLEADLEYVLTVYHNDSNRGNRGFAADLSGGQGEYGVLTSSVSGTDLFTVIKTGTSDNLPVGNEMLDPTVISFSTDGADAVFRLQSDASTNFLALSGFTLQVAVPEPSSILLFALGSVGLGFRQRV